MYKSRKLRRELISSSETVRLRASDPEAVAYLKRLAAKPGRDEDKSDSATKQPLPQQETPTPVPSAPSGQDKSMTDAKADVSVATSVVAPSVAARPRPPRRKRQTLEQMSAALDKGKKMTTLEKVFHYVIDP